MAWVRGWHKPWEKPGEKNDGPDHVVTDYGRSKYFHAEISDVLNTKI